jgi:hypothetical protein
MTWRRFIILMRGLSPQSATVAAMTARVHYGTRERVIVISGRDKAQAAFVALFGRSSAPA